MGRTVLMILDLSPNMPSRGRGRNISRTKQLPNITKILARRGKGGGSKNLQPEIDAMIYGVDGSCTNGVQTCIYSAASSSTPRVRRLPRLGPGRIPSETWHPRPDHRPLGSTRSTSRGRSGTRKRHQKSVYACSSSQRQWFTARRAVARRAVDTV